MTIIVCENINSPSNKELFFFFKNIMINRLKLVLANFPANTPRTTHTIEHTFFSLIRYMSIGAPLLITRKILQILLGTLTFAVLARVLTKEQFAIYTLAFTFITLFRLAALPGIGKAISQGFARGNTGGFRHALLLSLLCSFGGSLIIGSIGIWNYHNNSIETAIVLLVTATLFPLQTGLLYWQDVLSGQERYGRLLAFEAVSFSLKTSGIITCALLFPDKLYLVVLAALFAPALVNAIATLFILREVPAIAKGEENAISYGVRITLYQIPTVLSTQLDKLVLFYYISPEALAVYSVAMRIPELSYGLIFEANATLGPLFARQKYYTKALKTFTSKLWLIYFGISVFGALFIVPLLIPLLAGKEYEEATVLAQIMTVGASFGFYGNIQFRFVKSQLDSKRYLYITVLSGSIDVILILSLIIMFGLPGAVAAFVLKRLCYSIVVNSALSGKHISGKLSMNNSSHMGGQ